MEVIFLETDLLLFESDLFGNESLVVQKHFVPRGKSFPPHWHDFLELEMIVSGEGEHIHNNQKYKIGPGDAYLMSYYDFHALTANTDLVTYCIHFNETVLDEEISRFLSSSLHRFHCRFDTAEAKNICDKIEQMLFESTHQEPFFRQMQMNLISSLVISVIRKTAKHTQVHTPKLIQQAIAYTHSNFRQDLSLEILAKQLSISKNHLGVTFKNWIGSSYNDYLNTIRLKYACNLLTVSDLSVKEIAFASGYHSVEYFVYRFKYNLNVTPGEYRQQTKKR